MTRISRVLDNIYTYNIISQLMKEFNETTVLSVTLYVRREEVFDILLHDLIFLL